MRLHTIKCQSCMSPLSLPRSQLSRAAPVHGSHQAPRAGSWHQREEFHHQPLCEGPLRYVWWDFALERLLLLCPQMWFILPLTCEKSRCIPHEMRQKPVLIAPVDSVWELQVMATAALSPLPLCCRS